MRNFWILLMALVFTGCGYKPTSQIAQDVLGDRVYVEVAISIQDAQNSVLVKDAVKEAMISRLNRDVVSRSEAQTLIFARLGTVSFSPTLYDKDGYVIAYKAHTNLRLRTVYESGKEDNIMVSGEYDFTIEPNSVISDAKRFEAIKNASYEALDEYVALLAIRGLHEHNK